jgi:hypothetical protein
LDFHFPLPKGIKGLRQSSPYLRTCDLMNTRMIFRTSLKILAGFSLGIALFAVSSCGVVHEQVVNYNIKRQYDSELKKLMQGHEAFQKGDFKKALETFDNLRHQAKNDEIVRKAIFALACTHFALAKTPEEFKAAMALWQTWKQILPAPIAPEDPRLLDQLLHRELSRVEAKTKKEDASNSTKTIQYRQELKTKEREIHSLKQKLEAKEKEIVALKQQNMCLKEKEVELEKLRNQIKALEAIEHKIQSKKKKITSP